LFPQALDQLAKGLRQALRDYDVYDENHDPRVSVETGAAELADAAASFQQVYSHLSAAQEAINLQGVNTDEQDRLRRPPSLKTVETPEESDRR
jgi:hypothetical protein